MLDNTILVIYLLNLELLSSRTYDDPLASSRYRKHKGFPDSFVDYSVNSGLLLFIFICKEGCKLTVLKQSNCQSCRPLNELRFRLLLLLKQ